jgi:lipopolysaccharide export system permease protein
MKKYQKYIIKTYISSFLRTLLFIGAIIVSIKTLNAAQKFTKESSVDIQTLFMISLHIIPYTLNVIAPFVAAISSITVTHSLLATSQITILQSAKLSNLKISSVYFLITIPITCIAIYNSSFILPKIFSITQDAQQSIIKQQVKHFLTPNTVKTFQNITVITSPDNAIKQIPFTFIHQQTKDGEFIFAGNIKNTWLNSEMIGIQANNATILTIEKQNENLMKFDSLETQINFFTKETAKKDIDKLNIKDLIKQYHSHPNKQYIKEFNQRIVPYFAIILLPFAITTILIKFHNNRTKIKIKTILYMIFSITYILISCFSFVSILNTLHTFPIIYANIILTFIFIYFLNNNNFLEKKEYAGI